MFGNYQYQMFDFAGNLRALIIMRMMCKMHFFGGRGVRVGEGDYQFSIRFHCTCVICIMSVSEKQQNI